MSRRFRLAATATALTLVITACGGGSSPDSGSGAGEDGDSTQITQTELTFQPMSAGTLIVCTDAPYEPFEFQDESGNWTGFDMDLMGAVAERYGLALKVEQQAAEGIWLAPAAGKCDVAASAITINEDNVGNALFSDPYFEANQSLLVRAEDVGTLVDLESMAGKTIGVLTGSEGEAYARANAASSTIQSFDDTEAMYLALESGNVDGVVHDYAISASRASREGSKTGVSATLVTDRQYGFAVAKDNVPLQEAINESLNEFRAMGIYDEIFARYFGSATGEEE